MAKEEEDTEVFQTMMPCQQINLTVSDPAKDQRIVRARSIHRCELSNDTPPDTHGTYNFSLDNYVLPHQGFSIWWKRKPVAMQPRGADAVDTSKDLTHDDVRPDVH